MVLKEGMKICSLCQEDAVIWSKWRKSITAIGYWLTCIELAIEAVFLCVLVWVVCLTVRNVCCCIGTSVTSAAVIMH